MIRINLVTVLEQEDEKLFWFARRGKLPRPPYFVEGFDTPYPGELTIKRLRWLERKI